MQNNSLNQGTSQEDPSTQPDQQPNQPRRPKMNNVKVPTTAIIATILLSVAFVSNVASSEQMPMINGEPQTFHENPYTQLKAKYDRLSDRYDTLSDGYDTLSDRYDTLSDGYYTLSDENDELYNQLDILEDNSNNGLFVAAEADVVQHNYENLRKITSTEEVMSYILRVAYNSSTREETLRELSYFYDAEIRANVADNPNTPLNVLFQLLNDSESYVRRNAKKELESRDIEFSNYENSVIATVEAE